MVVASPAARLTAAAVGNALVAGKCSLARIKRHVQVAGVLATGQGASSLTPSEAKWRVGRKVGRTLYAMLYDEDSDSDVLIGMMDTPQLAEEAVRAHNETGSANKHERMWERLRQRTHNTSEPYGSMLRRMMDEVEHETE